MSKANDAAETTFEARRTHHAFSTAAARSPTMRWRIGRLLRRGEKPIARLFHVAYMAKTLRSRKPRPITFVFNGGPGAASAYLHVGALGPRRVVFNRDGSLPPPPAQLSDNRESWLPFTDLVFIDPIGTGFSGPSRGKGQRRRQ